MEGMFIRLTRDQFQMTRRLNREERQLRHRHENGWVDGVAFLGALLDIRRRRRACFLGK